ncbi:MAG: POTRA domain-containing protein [Bdellovibrionales bacterium]
MKFSTLFVSMLLVSMNAFAGAVEEEKAEQQQQLILEDIICVGNKKTKCSLIRKEIRLKPNKAVKQDELKNAKIRLNLLGLFDSVDMSLEKGSAKGRVDLKIEVKEASSYYTVTGLQFGKYEKEWTAGSAQFTLGNRNLFGKGKRLALTYTTDINELDGYDGSATYNRARINYTDPNLFGSKRFFGSIDLSHGKNNGRYGASNYTTGSLELGYRIRKFSYLTLGYGKLGINYEDDNDKAFDGNYKQNDFILGYGFNTQDDAYFPTRGSRFDLKIALGSSGVSMPGFYSGGTFSDFDWRTTWGIGNKYYLTGFMEKRSYDDSEEFLNSGLGLEMAKQVRKNRKDKDISDARFYIAPSINGYSGFNGTAYGVAAGVKLRSKKYGLARIELFYRGDSDD